MALPLSLRRPCLRTKADARKATPNVYADQIEWMCAHLSRRDCVCISLHPHNDRGRGAGARQSGWAECSATLRCLQSASEGGLGVRLLGSSIQRPSGEVGHTCPKTEGLAQISTGNGLATLGLGRTSAPPAQFDAQTLHLGVKESRLHRCFAMPAALYRPFMAG